MLHVLKLHSLSWPPGGDSSGCTEVNASCVKAAFSLMTTRGRLLWLYRSLCFMAFIVFHTHRHWTVSVWNMHKRKHFMACWRILEGESKVNTTLPFECTNIRAQGTQRNSRWQCTAGYSNDYEQISVHLKHNAEHNRKQTNRKSRSTSEKERKKQLNAKRSVKLYLFANSQTQRGLQNTAKRLEEQM